MMIHKAGRRCALFRHNDSLQLDGTGNIILYSVGDGTDSVSEPATANGGNRLKLSGVTANALTIGVGLAGTMGTLLLTFIYNPGDGFDVIEADAMDRVVFGAGIERAGISAKAIAGVDANLGILVSLGNGEQMWLQGEGRCPITKAIDMPERSLRTACNGGIRRVESARQSSVMAR